jgi:CheY-like chemotaxis protein
LVIHKIGLLTPNYDLPDFCDDQQPVNEVTKQFHAFQVAYSERRESQIAPLYVFTFFGFTTSLPMETIVLQETDQDFLEVIDKARPHVVILDYRLSGEDSQQVCREIKKRYPHLPVLAMSCNSNINEVYDQHGFDGYIPKPFDLEELYAVLRRYIPPLA